LPDYNFPNQILFKGTLGHRPPRTNICIKGKSIICLTLLSHRARRWVQKGDLKKSVIPPVLFAWTKGTNHK